MLRYIAIACVLFFILADPAAAQSPSSPSEKQREFTQKLVAAAMERTRHTVRYDPSYRHIPYPNGDVPADTGVCTDEIIRVYRAVGIDLQQEVHEDMQRNFSVYPNQRRWLFAQRPDAGNQHACRRLFSRRSRDVGFGRQRAAYRNSG